MTKTIPAPAMPMGARFDPDETILHNATVAWEAEKGRRRTQGEHNARVLARRVFRRDDIEFQYDARIDLAAPTFEVDGELIVFNGEDFSVIEFCGECGKEPKGRRFRSLAALGRVLEERDADDPHVCRMCAWTKAQKS